MSTLPDKTALIEALREKLVDELSTVRESQQAAQDGAIHEETRQEDPKDTRAIEAQYVARGFAERVEDLQASLVVLSRIRLDTFGPEDPVGLSAVVGVHDGDREKVYFIVPVAGGETLIAAGSKVLTLTPSSPLGTALCGKHVDDEIELDLPGRRLTATIDWTC